MSPAGPRKDAPTSDVDDSGLGISRPKRSAAGIPGVVHGLEDAYEQMGVTRSLRTLPLINQKRGFDCPGCAWPEPTHQHIVEFCENGAKAVAEEATLRRTTRDFFAAHPISELEQRSGYWLGQQGRLTEPMVKRSGSDNYEPISWDDALDLIAEELRSLDSPDEAVFYTSGRTSNEAAFCYQLLARTFGTNNLPDCSNRCHESSGAALTETIGAGKGSITLDDLDAADLILIAGQNPGTNHPRMLTALQQAKQTGARIVAINPLPEAGLINFRNPQRPSGVVGHGTPMADRFMHLRLNGDLALFQALGRLLIEAEDAAPGTVLDHDFIDTYGHGFEEYAAHVRALDWGDVEAATGVPRAEIEALHRDVLEAKSIVVCWAMGLTQHKNSVPTIREIVNFLLLRGNIGRPGAGVCPVRGHSNVQGDRTMGIWEQVPDAFLDALRHEFGFEPPRKHGFDTVDSIRAMRDGRAKVFMAAGGNFVSATPDREQTEAAMRRLRLTVQVSTKLNRSHVVTGETALILPTLGRTERHIAGGDEQVVTVEDSMGVVHPSRGHLKPATRDLRSEVAIICQLGQRLAPSAGVPWRTFENDHAAIRDRIARVVPGFADFNAKIADGGRFTLPHAPRDERRFPTSTGKANFTVNQLDILRVPPGRLLLQTIRSHDQFNTTVYGLDDRYRGISNGRRVIFVNPHDLATLGIADGAVVDIVSEYADNVERRAEDFRVVAYPTARDCAAAYYPETNVLVPLDSVADTSNTPTSKSIVVRLEASNR